MVNWFSAGFDFIVGIVTGLLFLLVVSGIVVGIVANPPSLNLTPIWELIKEYWLVIIFTVLLFLTLLNAFRKGGFEEEVE